MNTSILKIVINIFFRYLYLLLLSSITFTLENELLGDSLAWHKISNNNKIDIFTADLNGYTFCKASKLYDFTSDKVKNILDDKLSYPDVFDRIESVKVLSNDAVYIKLRLPFPFSGRDYIVDYTYKETRDIQYYVYRYNANFDIPIDKEYVRLINAYGIWKIEPVDEGKTQLTHIWNGELRGKFPNWALKYAWIAQGEELLISIDKALY